MGEHSSSDVYFHGGPMLQTCMWHLRISTLSVQITFMLWSRNHPESIPKHPFLKTFEVFANGQSLDEHRTCPLTIRIGSVRAVANTSLSVLNLHRAHPWSIFFSQLGKHCQGWLYAWRTIGEHSSSEGHVNGGLRLEPCTKLVMISTLLVPIALMLWKSQPSWVCSKAHFPQDVWSVFERAESLDEHRTCSLTIRFGSLSTRASNSLSVLNLHRVHPCFIYFPQIGKHCQGWLYAWRSICEHSFSDGHCYGDPMLEPCTDSSWFPHWQFQQLSCFDSRNQPESVPKHISSGRLKCLWTGREFGWAQDLLSNYTFWKPKCCSVHLTLSVKHAPSPSLFYLLSFTRKTLPRMIIRLKKYRWTQFFQWSLL